MWQDRPYRSCVCRDGQEMPEKKDKTLVRESVHSRIHRPGQQFFRTVSSEFYMQWKKVFSFVNSEYFGFPFNCAPLCFIGR